MTTTRHGDPYRDRKGAVTDPNRDRKGAVTDPNRDREGAANVGHREVAPLPDGRGSDWETDEETRIVEEATQR